MLVDVTKFLNQRFSLSYSTLMGPMEIPSQYAEIIKIPAAHYAFGANFMHPKLMLFGRVLNDGRVEAGVKCALSDNLSMNADAQLTSQPHMSNGKFNIDYKGIDYRTRFKFGNGAMLGASYIQSVTPHLSLGGELVWAGEDRESNISYGARYNTDKMVAVGQIANTGNVALSYAQKMSEKVSLASDFIYNYFSRDVTASVGYDYINRQCRLRGKIDSNGCTSAFVEEWLDNGLKVILSAEVSTYTILLNVSIRRYINTIKIKGNWPVIIPPRPYWPLIIPPQNIPPTSPTFHLFFLQWSPVKNS
ncbi:putative Porin domain superfamily, eukaryotic porin/Tom40 [Helianthus annuus]|nr:putative Porin domain superfamily, eukaryotic porin/Tom40 [Helianthus annuus]